MVCLLFMDACVVCLITTISLADISYADVGQNAQPRPAASSQPAKKRTLYATLQASSGQTQTSKVPGQAPKMLFLKAVQVIISADAKLRVHQCSWQYQL